ncbi:hypothetical protein ACFYR1_18530 [Streptomyces canus]|uniref:hypothetical protein n=1 Tax=Streptomyces canus TaxID=58343 RepID=UPI0036CAA83E
MRRGWSPRVVDLRAEDLSAAQLPEPEKAGLARSSAVRRIVTVGPPSVEQI